ncbi:hypothetical protein O6P43_032825 [Quillaja saponaria]|uniref:Uncharacterized protein n=1 Tax=Quillaja saponaria TaxID=32244 RepID=A0AAD7P677_QUISA|nr:hypothetical protein O6P43_032825 [Quillaja saponaria]
MDGDNDFHIPSLLYLHPDPHMIIFEQWQKYLVRIKRMSMKMTYEYCRSLEPDKPSKLPCGFCCIVFPE